MFLFKYFFQKLIYIVFVMVYSCCVPGCKTGYKSNQSSEKIALFNFPKDDELLSKWLRAIPRKNWTLTKFHKVCAKHFCKEDFQQSSSDTCITRKKSRPNATLQRLRLLPNSVPHIFPALPNYLSVPQSSARTTFHGTASARLEKENLKIHQSNVQLLIEDSFSDFETFNKKLKDAVFPSGYIIVNTSLSTQFHFITSVSNEDLVPNLNASVIITSDLQIKIFILGNKINQELYRHLLPSKSLQTVTELSNVLAWCKTALDMSSSVVSNCKKTLMLASSLLQNCLEHANESIFSSGFEINLLQFIVEQLDLLQATKHGRRYSTNTTILAFIWKMTSNALYRKLRDVLILPSPTRLCQLSSAISVEHGSIQLSYLEKRTADLSNDEKIVTLLIDEVYTAQRVEYSNGSFIGFTDDGFPAKTVLTFMVQSVHGKYKDVVCLVPINRLDTNILALWFRKVMMALDKLFLVIAVSVDNHICNRNLYLRLCDGQLKPSIVHPTKPNEKLFLLFDSTHNFKNIFNNFNNRGRFSIPTTGYNHVLGDNCTPCFSHVKHLYALEEHKSLKVAYALKKESLNPSGISRTSPQHAIGVFHHSTILALEMYADEYPSFLQTASFLKFVNNIWKILSVRSKFKEHRTRDEFCAPMGSDQTGAANVQYLRTATEIFQKWQNSRRSGLTSQTFTACIQTMSVFPELLNHLQCNHGFSYILSGKFTSDPIEGRFGWYRQMNGGNYFMSVKQLLEAEKKIRVLSLLQQQALLSSSNLISLDTLPLEHSDTSSGASDDVLWLVDFFENSPENELSDTDANVTYFVSGYVGRSVSTRRKCSSCKSLLVAGHDPPSLFECIDEDYKQLFEKANRGGLSEPSELCFATTALAMQYYTVLVDDDVAKTRFYSLKNQRSAFVLALSEHAKSSPHLQILLKQTCSIGHSSFKAIVETTFNCFAKNELKRINSRSKPECSSKKLRKLTSQT